MANRTTNENEINCNEIKNFFRNLFRKCTCCHNDDDEKKHASSIEVEMPTDIIITSSIDNNDLINKINMDIDVVKNQYINIDNNFKSISDKVKENKDENSKLSSKYDYLQEKFTNLENKFNTIFKKINNIKIEQEFIRVDSTENINIDNQNIKNESNIE